MNDFFFMSLDKALYELESDISYAMGNNQLVLKGIRVNKATYYMYFPETNRAIELCEITKVLHRVVWTIDNKMPEGKIFVRWGQPK